MEFTISDSEFANLRTLVYELTGIKLSDAKRQMLKSRLSRRLRATNLDTFSAYYELLCDQKPDGPEITEFINAVTTNKTDFFREPHHFDFITNTLIPEIEKRTPYGARRLNVWHAGCSTGEEPYTLSMTLHEALRRREAWNVRQLATDIDSRVLEHAQRGVYEMSKLDPISDNLRKQYFLRGKGPNAESALVKSELKEWLTLKRLNLLSEPWPFSRSAKFDVIFCRNVMIYFDKPTQQKLVERFNQLLVPGGYLFIGHSESLFGISNGFSSLGKTIYKSCAEAA